MNVENGATGTSIELVSKLFDIWCEISDNRS